MQLMAWVIVGTQRCLNMCHILKQFHPMQKTFLNMATKYLLGVVEATYCDTTTLNVISKKRAVYINHVENSALAEEQ